MKHVVFALLVGTLLLVEVWVTAGLLTQVSSGDTHRVINTLSEARQTGEVEADKGIFVPAVVTLGTSVTNFHWVHTVLVGTAIVGTFKLSRSGTGVLLTV